MLHKTFLLASVILFFLADLRAEKEPSDSVPDDIPVAEVIPEATATSGDDMLDNEDLAAIAEEIASEEPGLMADAPTEEEGDPLVETGEASINPVEADRNDDGQLTDAEIALQDHREQLEIYDLNDDKKISPDEWKAANKENRDRDEKFTLVDKDQDGQIDEGEAMQFLAERISLGNTYVDAAGEANMDIDEKVIEDAAPSEVRVTLFSIPLGD